MLELIKLNKVSEFSLYSEKFKTNQNRMAEFSGNSVNFDSLDDDMDTLGHYNTAVNNTEVRTNPAPQMSSINEAKEPPDKSDFELLLGATSDSAQQNDTNILIFGEPSVNNGGIHPPKENVASLTSAFEGNYQSLMNNYAEEALKTFQRKDALQLRLEAELSALTEGSPLPEPTESNFEESKIPTEPPPVPALKPEPASEPEPKHLPTDIHNISKDNEEFVSFTLPKKEEPMVVESKETENKLIVNEIVDELIPFPFVSKVIIDDILDSIISNVTLICLPPKKVSSFPSFNSSLSSSISSPTSSPPPLVPLPSKRVRGKIYPPVFPPLERPGRVTNRLEYIRKKVVPAMFNHKDAWPFKTPVDAIKLNIPDYHKIVSSPMDLGTIKKRLVNRYYWNAQECQNDFKLMFGNCYRYNKPEYDIFLMCKELERAYDKKIELMQSFSELDIESESGFTVQKRRKKLPGEAPARKKPKPLLGFNSYNKAAAKYLDFEDEIPVAQVHMPYHLAKKFKRPPPREEESSSEESEEESDESESDDEPGMMPSRAFPGHVKSYVAPPSYKPPKPPTPSQPPKPLVAPKASEKKQKHLCKYCEQPFLSRTVRDLHEKAKHQGQGFSSLNSSESSPQPVIKKVPPLKVSLKKSNNSLQIVPVKQDSSHPSQNKLQNSNKNGPQHNPGQKKNSIQNSYPQKPTDNKSNNAFYSGPGSAQGMPSVNKIPTPQLPNTDSDMMNFVDKKHRAMSKQRQQKNSQSGQSYYRKPPQPKVQNNMKAAASIANMNLSTNNSTNASKDSLESSIPEELLFPDTPTPSFSKVTPGRPPVPPARQAPPPPAIRSNLQDNNPTNINSPPVFHPSDRPSNIISPPTHKFPKLSPDSGFPGSPDLDPTLSNSHVDAGIINKPLGKLPGPPDMSKFVPNPSIIKHTDPRSGVMGPQQQQRQVHPAAQSATPGGVMITNNSKIQRRFSNSSQLSPQMSEVQSPSNNGANISSVGNNRLGQSVISRKSVDSIAESDFIQQRRLSGGLQQQPSQQPLQQQKPLHQQQQQLHQLVGIKNGQQFVVTTSGRPSIVQHSNIMQQQQVTSRPAQQVTQAVLQQQQQQQVTRNPQAVMQQQQTISRPPTAVIQQQQISNNTIPSVVLQQQQPVPRQQTAVLPQTVGRPPAAVMQGGIVQQQQPGRLAQVRLPQQPVSRPTSVLQTMSRPPPAVLQQSNIQISRPPAAVMSALAGPRPISLQSRNDQQLPTRNVLSVPLKLPTQPLPPQQQTHLVQQQHQPQQQPPPQPHQNKPKSLDVLAQTLQLSEISADLDFDFEPAEPVRMGGNLIPPSETQELTLGDLKHLRDSTKVVNNGGDTLSQLLDFTYNDVISAADTLTVYPGPSEAEQIIFSSSSAFLGSSPVMVQSSRPTNSVMVSSLDANSVLFASPSSSSMTSTNSISTFSGGSGTGDIVYSDTDLINLETQSYFR